MKPFKSIVVAVLAVLIAVAYATPPSVSAQSSAALSIVPRKDYTIEPGDSVNDTLVIRNLDASAPLELSLRVVDFTFTDDGGTPKLMLDEDAPQTTWSLKPFLDVPKTVSIPPKTSRTLDMSVAIPEGHGAGSYYSAIIYSSGAPEGGNVGLSASGVTLVFTTIPGDVHEDLKLERFGAYSQAAPGKPAGYVSFALDEPLSMAFTLKNEGNITESPVGSITLKDLFGNERTITDINPNSSLALIGQTRTFTSCIMIKSEEVDFNGTRTEAQRCVSPGLWPGYYSATLNLFYGQNGNRTQEIVSSSSFWYMPIWFIVLLLVVITYITFKVRKFIRKRQPTSYRAASQQKSFSRRKR